MYFLLILCRLLSAFTWKTVIQPRCQASSSPTRKCHSHKSQESSYFHYSIGRINQSLKLKGEN